jgi:antitoxin MazE
MQKLTRWGNSTGLRLPACVLEGAGLKPGSYVSVRLLNSGEIRIRPWGRLCPADEEQVGSVQAIAKPTEATW